MKKFFCLFGLAFVFFALISFFQVEALAQSPTPTIETNQIQNLPVAVPEPSEKAIAFYNSGVVLWIINNILGLLIPFLFLQTKLSAKIRDLAVKFSGKWVLTLVIYFIIFVILNYLVTLPLDFYQGFVRQHDYGLSNQTFARWFTNSLLEQIVALFIGCLFLWIPYLLLRNSPKRWWLYTSILLVPFYCFGILLSPVFIDPLFNNFGEMKNKALEKRILALAERAGIEESRVFVVDKSADTKALNAYVTGFMNTKRIVLWDTIIEKLDEEELLFVMGHEMGHYSLGHVWHGLTVLSILTFIFAFLVYKISAILIGKYGHNWGFSDLGDPAAMPLIILIVGFLFLVITPIGFAYTRYSEHESDRFGLEITRNNQACATSFVKLQTENLIIPRPNWLMKIVRSTHPPIGERIDFCNEYRPWEEGKPLYYQHLFK